MSNQINILVANGVNLDLLGQREAAHYGRFTLDDLEKAITAEANALSKYFGLSKVSIDFYQSNSEADFLKKISSPWDGAIINAGAWTHTSLAIADRLKAIDKSFIEVHISNLAAREEFRQKSFIAPHALGVIYGLGLDSYLAGLYALLKKLS